LSLRYGNSDTPTLGAAIGATGISPMQEPAQEDAAPAAQDLPKQGTRMTDDETGISYDYIGPEPATLETAGDPNNWVPVAQ
jgi:hypothetical protein